MTRLLIILILSVGTALCQTGAVSKKAGDEVTAREVRAARERSNQAIVKHDIQAFADTLSSDFVMVRGSGAFTPSREAYIDTFRKAFADPKSISYKRTPDKIEVSDMAPLVAEHGHWVGLLPNGAPAYSGTYLAMWRLTESGWKLRSELFVVLNCHEEKACSEYRETVPPGR